MYTYTYIYICVDMAEPHFWWVPESAGVLFLKGNLGGTWRKYEGNIWRTSNRHACMRACMHACMHVCMHACMRAWRHKHDHYVTAAFRFLRTDSFQLRSYVQTVTLHQTVETSDQQASKTVHGGHTHQRRQKQSYLSKYRAPEALGCCVRTCFLGPIAFIKSPGPFHL